MEGERMIDALFPPSQILHNLRSPFLSRRLAVPGHVEHDEPATTNPHFVLACAIFGRLRLVMPHHALLSIILVHCLLALLFLLFIPPLTLLPPILVLRCPPLPTHHPHAPNTKRVHRPRPSRLPTDIRKSHPRPLHQRIEQATLSNIAAADERDFGDRGARERAEFGGGEEEGWGCAGCEEAGAVRELVGVGGRGGEVGGVGGLGRWVGERW